MQPLYHEYLDVQGDFLNYDDFNKNFRIKKVDSFNFAYDIVDRYGREDPDRPALLWTDPEGNVYRYESSWIYAPEYMNDDVWYISLAGMGLTYSLDQNGYPRGGYRIAYYVDGDLADAITFELK